MVGNPSTHPSISHLGSRFFLSKLVDTLPLELLVVIVMCCAEWESWALEITFPLGFPSPVELLDAAGDWMSTTWY